MSSFIITRSILIWLENVRSSSSVIGIFLLLFFILNWLIVFEQRVPVTNASIYELYNSQFMNIIVAGKQVTVEHSTAATMD